jgi:prepilin-type N-terminal cleavage/methylation domain-containing protein
MKIKTNRRAGFTLVEIMIVVAIIGLLAAIAIPNFVRARESAQLNSIINNLRIIEGAKDQYALERRLGTGADVGGSGNLEDSPLKEYIRGGKINLVINESYTPNAIGEEAQVDTTGKLLTFEGGTYTLSALTDGPTIVE